MRRILGDILLHERDIRRHPPKDPEDLLKALKEVRKLQSRIRSIADKLPRPFQMDNVNSDHLWVPRAFVERVSLALTTDRLLVGKRSCVINLTYSSPTRWQAKRRRTGI